MECKINNTPETKEKDYRQVEVMKNWYSVMEELGKDVLKINIDYGLIPGVNKPVLLKPGAEKLCKAFDLQVKSIDCISEKVELNNNYIDFSYKCIITSKSGIRLGICDGNANSKEEMFRYMYVPAAKVPCKKELDLLKFEGKGKWKKVNDKWVWFERTENLDILSLKNSIQKVAQKRAFVGAILMAVGASEFFTQDIISN